MPKVFFFQPKSIFLSFKPYKSIDEWSFCNDWRQLNSSAHTSKKMSITAPEAFDTIQQMHDSNGRQIVMDYPQYGE